jgi:hyaluronoglucosaminidase
MKITFRRSLIVACCIAILHVSTALGESPFAIRGIKGLWWEGLDNYRDALPWVAAHDMNFLMFCYSSFPASGKSWRDDYSASELAGFAELAGQARQLKIELCLSFNPGIWSKPPLQYSDDADYQHLWQKVQRVHATGIHSFALCLDDINTTLQPADARRFGTLADAQVYLVNRLFKDIQTLKPVPRLIFCPSAYTTHEAEAHQAYTKAIGEQIDQGVEMFWTGPEVCSASITAGDARKIAALLHRKPIIWDNYPVNDMFPWRPLMAPVKGRAPDLGREVAGLMANPMKQWQISKIPLGTLAVYLRNPSAYDPAQAMQQVLAGYPAAQQKSVVALQQLYGSSFLGEAGYPPSPGVHQLQQLRALRRDLAADLTMAGIWRELQPAIDDDLRKLAPGP